MVISDRVTSESTQTNHLWQAPGWQGLLAEAWMHHFTDRANKNGHQTNMPKVGSKLSGEKKKSASNSDCYIFEYEFSKGFIIQIAVDIIICFMMLVDKVKFLALWQQ